MPAKKSTRKNMNKTELVASIVKNSTYSKTEAERMLNLVTDTIIEAMSTGYDVSLINFGSFHVQDRQSREGYNPKTGTKMAIPAYKQPVFRAGKKMKDSVRRT